MGEIAKDPNKLVLLLVLLSFMFPAVNANQISFPGDVVEKVTGNTTLVGYVVRVVNATYHDPPVLVVWKINDNNYTASWENISNINLTARSESANFTGKIFPCKGSPPYGTDHHSYVKENLKTGMLVKYTANAHGRVWKGDLCVKLGNESQDSIRLWCYRSKLTHVTDNFTDIAIIGVTNYPGVYEYLENGDLTGNYRYTVVTHLSSMAIGGQSFVGKDYSATVTLRCGNGLPIDVSANHDKKAYNNYETLNSSLLVTDEINLTSVWKPIRPGEQYVEFRVSDSDNAVYTGFWIRPIEPVLHDVEITGSEPDSRFIRVDSSFSVHQSLTNGTPAFMVCLYHNTSTGNQSLVNFTDSTERTFSMVYNERGLHELLSVAWNALTIEIIQISIVIVKEFPIENLTVMPDKNVEKTNENFQFTASATAGSSSTCVIDYGDGNTETIHQNFSTIFDSFSNETDLNVSVHTDTGLQQNFNKAYSDPGVYLVQVVCTNELYTSRDLTSVIVQTPISEYTLVFDEAAYKFGEVIPIEWTMSQGTNVTVEIFYNNVSCCKSGLITDEGGTCDCLINNTSLFDPDSFVNIDAVARNLVSNESSSMTVTVLVEVTITNLSMFTTTSDFGSGIPGFGINKDKFPAEQSVKFIASYTGGLATSITWMFTCNQNLLDELLCVSDLTACGGNHANSIQLDYSFPANINQRCTAFLEVKNAVSESNFTVELDLDESFVYDSMSNNGPVKINETVTITILLEKFGTDTCLVVDPGDDSSLLVYGFERYCESDVNVSEIHPNIKTHLPFNFKQAYPSTTTIVIQHIYGSIATYDVKISASNYVSTATDTMKVVVLDLECDNPNVTITGVSYNISNVLGASWHHRSAELFLSTENEIYCEKTEVTRTNWTVFKFDEDPRTANKRVRHLAKSVYQFPGTVDLSSPELFIPGKILPYGFYAITAKVYFEGLPDVFGENTTYVQVVQTPWLEPALTTGTFFEEYFKNQAVFNASATVDPDFDGIDGITFQWFCKDVEDNVPFDLQNEPLKFVPNINDTHPPAKINSTGCFGTGRGQLNKTGVILRLETDFMVEGKYFTITLLVSKHHPEFGVRTATTDIYFHVQLGLPPSLTVSCRTNCKKMVNPDEKLILEAKCTKLCYGQLDFSWNLFRFDDFNQPEPFNLTDLNEVPKDILKNMVTNPIKELSMAFKPLSLEPGRKYVLQLIAKRPNGVYGELRHTLKMNAPPENGSCTIHPFNGTAMKTTFNITCRNWRDSEPPLSYEYAYDINNIKTLFHIKNAVASKVVHFGCTMPVGDRANDNKLVVYVEIKDSLQGRTSLNFTIQVAPPGEEDSSMTLMMSLVSGETNQLDQMLASGNTQGALGLASVMASVLNDIGKNATSGNKSADEIDKMQKIDQMKQEILTSMSKIEAKDLSTVLQLGGTLQVVTDNPDDTSAETQEIATKLCNKTIASLQDLPVDETSFNSVQSGVGNLAGSIGQLVAGASSDTANKSSSGAERTLRAISMVTNLHDTTLRYLVPNEGPTTTSTKRLTIQSEKVSVVKLGSKGNQATNCGFKVPSATVFGLGDIVEDINATISQLSEVSLKMGVFTENPYTWDNTSKTVSSKVASLELGFTQKTDVSNLTEEIAITVARDPAQFPPPTSFYMKPAKTDPNKDPSEREYLKFHCFNRTSQWTAMNFELHPEDPNLGMKVYLKTGGKPNLETNDFDLQFELPNFSSCDVENETQGGHVSQTNENGTIQIDPFKHCSVHPYNVFISNVDFNETGEHCFGVKASENVTDNDDDPTSPKSRRKRSFACDIGKRRMRRSCVIIPPPPPPPPTESSINVLVADNLGFDGKYFFPNQTPNYNLTMFESSCLYWDEENQTWAGHGCRVGPLTSRDNIQCFCNHLTSFGSDLVVAPNPIDFDSVFANFGSLQDNVAVLALISTILGLYIIGVIWARRADKRDALMTGPTILPNREGSYRYLITIYTGNRLQSGTTAKVFFKMDGDQDETLPVKLWDPDRPCFERAQENTFVVSYAGPVGEVTYVQIWHNNTGTSPSWYLSRLSVKDLQTEQQWYFVCDNWLAVESADGKVCRVLPVANNQELTNFNQLFTARAVKGLADGHLWFSIFSRPPNSNFTRVQRLSCCLCLLCCTMITSAMFYNMGGEGPSPFTIKIGSMAIDMKQFVIALQSSLIIIPVNVAIVQIFRNLRPKKDKGEKSRKNSDTDDLQNITEEDDQKKVGKNKKSGEAPKGKLPHWFLYVAYALCYLSSAACIFFTLLYSIQWGEKVSTEWVIAMVTAFIQSVLLLQPVKVVVMAVVFAVLIRKPCDSDDEPTEVPVDEPPQQITREKKRRKKSKKVKIYCPPDPEKLLQARIKRLKEIKMNAILKEIGAFFIFLGMLMNVAYYHRDPNTYLLTKTLFETFDDVDAFGVDLGAVSDGDALWMWARETLVPGLYGTKWYNGKNNTKGYIANMEDYLVGVPRVRLLRVEEDTCSVHQYFEDTIPHCYSSYSVADEDTEEYEVSWKPLTSGTSRKRRDVKGPVTEKEWLTMLSEGSEKTTGEEKVRRKRAMDPIMSAASGRNRRKKKRLLGSASPKVYTIDKNALLPNGKVLSCLERWSHQTTLEMRGFPYWGMLSLYSGGGYPANLGYDPVTAYTVISDLHSNGWIDVQSRAVFVEFTVYNANTNLFGIVSIFFEFPASSGTYSWGQFQAARFYLRLNFTQTLSHVMVIFFMLYFLYREGKLVRKQRWAYFKGFWNWIETILICCEFVTIVLFLARLYEVDRNLLQLRENPNDYVGFQYAGSADAALCYTLGALVFFYNLRFLRLLRFNKTFLILGKIMRRVAIPVLNFCIPFFVNFMAFGLFAFSMFGSELLDYSTFKMTLVTQFSMTLGSFDFEALEMVDRFFGPLYFFAFVTVNLIILTNVFLAIINDSYGEIQEEEQHTENEYEVVDYVTQKLKTMLQTKSKKTKVAPKKRKRKTKLEVRPHYVSFKESKERNLLSSFEECEKRLDSLLNVIEEVVKGEAENESAVAAIPEDKRNDRCYQALLLMECIQGEPRRNGGETSEQENHADE